MKILLHFFTLPIHDTNNFGKNVRTLLVIALFVALFLWIFKPFDTNLYSGNQVLLAAMFGLVTLVIGTTFELVEDKVLHIDKEHPSWTFGKWLISTLILLLCISSGNFFLMNYLHGWNNLSLSYFLTFIVYTLSIGIFPIILLGVWKSTRYTRQFEAIATSVPAHDQPLNDTEIVLLPSRTGEDLELHISNILFLEARQNYVTVHYLCDDHLKQHVLRNTLKDLYSMLRLFPDFIQSHRSFLVNLGHVRNVSGNSQGLVLQLDTAGASDVPVSRSYIPEFRQRFN